VSSEHEAVPADGQADGDRQARADIYGLLGKLLARPPEAPLLQLLHGIDPAATPPDTAMHAAWRDLRAAALATDAARLQDEYFKLFIGLGRGELVPYASWYVHGFLMEKVLASLRRELTSLGFERRAGVAEPEDHVAAVCEIMGMIISDSELYLRESEFFETYVGSWIGRFFADLEAAETAVFYKAVGRLGRQFVDIERQYLSLPAG
jgi:TorA maturation chaperone TorD